MNFQHLVSNKLESKNWSLLECHKTPSTDGTLIDLIVFLDYGTYSALAKKQLIELDRAILHYFKEAQNISDIEERLENTMKKVNISAPAILSELGTTWPQHISALIIAQHQNDVVITHIGHLMAYLINGSHISPIVNSTHPVNPLKLFSDITRGTLSSNNILFLTSKNLLQFVSLDKIKNACQSNQQCTEIIKSYIGHQITQQNFAFASYQINLLAAPLPLSVSANTTTQSEEINREKEIEQEIPVRISTGSEKYLNAEKYDERIDEREIISSVNRKKTMGLQSLKILISSWFQKIKNPKSDRHQNKNSTSFRQSSSYTKKGPEQLDMRQLMLRSLKGLGGGFVMCILFLIGRPKAFAQLDQFAAKQLSYIYSLRLVEKLILIFALFIFLITANSLVLIGQNKISLSNGGPGSEIYEDIETKLTSAEASLIYNDYKNALVFLDSASELIKSLNPSTKTGEIRQKQLNEKLQKDYNSARQITEITDTQVISDLETQQPNLQKIDRFIVSTETEAFAFDQQGKKFYVINLLNGKSVGYDLNGIGEIVDITQDKINIIVLTKDRTIYAINKSNKVVEPAKINLHGDTTTLNSATVFNDSFYLLDTAIGQIYKHTRLSTRYSNATKWAHTGQDLLRTTRAMAVDGSLYTISSDGTLGMFFKGELKNTTTPNVSPSINNAISMIPGTDSDALYITEPNRIIKITKTGSLITQYYLGNGTISGSYIAPDASYIYVALDKKVIKANLK